VNQTDTTTLIATKDLNVEIAGKLVLKDFNFSLHDNETVTIIGPNGAGKSTLLKVLAGLMPAYRGNIVRKPGLRIGYVPQNLEMNSSLPISVAKFLRLGSGRVSDYDKALAKVGAAQLHKQQMHTLSGGEFQRVLLARAIARDPDLLLLDEPLQGVDVTGQVELYALIAGLREELNCSVVMVSHDLHLVMASSDRVLCLNHHLCCEGQPESVSQHPEFLRLFGPRAFKNIAVYTHHHDHHHDLHGNVVGGHESCGHD